jgi:hypothetical protein
LVAALKETFDVFTNLDFPLSFSIRTFWHDGLQAGAAAPIGTAAIIQASAASFKSGTGGCVNSTAYSSSFWADSIFGCNAGSRYSLPS